MKKFLPSICMAALVMGLNFCAPPIDLDIQPAAPKLVVSSQVIPEQYILVSVTRSFSSLETRPDTSAEFKKSIYVSNAFVTVDYFGITDTLTMISPGLYEGHNLLQYYYGDYHLTVLDNEKGLSANSSTIMLPRVQFDTVYPVVIRTPADTSITIHYELSDNQEIENYYVVDYVKRPKNSTNTPMNVDKIIAQGKNSTETFDLLSDDSFLNGKYSMNKKITSVKAKDTLAVMVSNITKGYYEFLSALKRSGTVFNTLASEPIHFPGNVNNGYGYFNACNPYFEIFDLNDY